MIDIQLKRAYEQPSKNDGTRVLVDRVWPRGVKKQDLALSDWCKDIAPSTELRQWFNHDPDKWPEFRRRYLSELADHKSTAQALLDNTQHNTLTLVYAAKNQEQNNARVIKEYLELLLRG
jgi:uncharacterized protein YeaO (DUF488 family)